MIQERLSQVLTTKPTQIFGFMLLPRVQPSRSTFCQGKCRRVKGLHHSWIRRVRRDIGQQGSLWDVRHFELHLQSFSLWFKVEQWQILLVFWNFWSWALKIAFILLWFFFHPPPQFLLTRPNYYLSFELYSYQKWVLLTKINCGRFTPSMFYLVYFL